MHKIAKKITQIGLTGLVGLSATFVALAPNAATAVSLRAASNLGLVGYWTFDEGTGLRANDFSGKNNYGTLSGTTKPTWVSGKHGKALSFDGTSGYVDAGNQSSVNLTTAITASVWIKYNVDPKTLRYNGIISKQVSTNAYQLQTYSTDGRIEFVIGTGVTAAASISNTVLKQGAWYHIVGTFDGSNVRMYVNGIADGTPAPYVGTIPISSNNLVIGKNYDGTNKFFNGLIDDVRIYSRALSAAEIYNLYKSGSQVVNKIEPVRLNQGLVGYWSFDGNTLYNNVADLSGSGNHGLLQPVTATSSMKVAGKLGQALKFNGSSTYLEHGDVLDIGLSNWSVAVWVKTADKTTSYTGIVQKADSSADDGRWALVLNNQKAQAVFDTGSSNVVTSNTSISDGKWHYIVSTWNRTGKMTLYVDGSSDGTPVDISSAAAFNAITNKSLRVGSYTLSGSANASNFFNGLIDDVRIYNRALNPSEIKALYNMGQATINKTPVNRLNQGLVGYWTFDGKDTATNIKDVSGNGNHGLLQPTNATSSMKVAGKIGQGLKFNGSTQSVAAVSKVDVTDAMTLTYWIRNDKNAESYIGNMRWNGVSGYAMTLNNGIFYWGNGTSQQAWSSGATSGLGKWNHIVITLDANRITSYKNGAYVNSVAKSISGNVGSGGYTLKLGMDASPGSYYLKGTLDDVRIYNRALSASEVKSLYNMGR
ncbi:MAG: hypothetical protein A3H57_03180 [Candidatus Taylorbacteria bacterium RIFCSPLOWO2_02_FULL_43_11]|uniref:Laminin G domain-containing protein n=1 Tax=Candidatus Taylorbacteria bacterium RIFCSPHIGHO2_02_FULL_43_32b TaxID=1802306 RepID=A0A1G2MI26_9BACT|nr:MAG: hypothetical protein A2743_00900 [Candidatus Taylorbacteria bacterium RIFCSPHIGHO2_01_FULL_43_47]OHA22681.1 MAG: hypothetical protein A3C72_01325 [Candidatus Taylorbacteria bacterium RIFCSPHIGHO2_02_FULL_43_32b]OHA36108.1 MAG: hypothetical protein A3H57_03180 [Candidatus Taylorbacteria bacterium RIFCSPLOWO2_02_FULL_43_11]